MIHRIDCHIFVDIKDGEDPEEIATDMQHGLFDTIADRWNPHFDHSDVIDAGVENIKVATDKEIDDAGLV